MTIYIVDIEGVSTRYTSQWKEHLPQQITKHTSKNVEVISGDNATQTTTPGAFLNFAGTNVYKSKQLEKIGKLFEQNKIKDGDYFLYTDAWNPTVIQLKYMAALLGVDIKIGGLWHAGSYDPQDFLGRLIGDTPWVRSAEHSMFSCYDHNFFATQFHIEMFEHGLLINENLSDSKIQRVGWPMEYLQHKLAPFSGKQKTNTVLFPHRLADEKQLDIFLDLKKRLPEYEFIVCQEKSLTKNEYHELLATSKVVFSANLQETLGISWYEGSLVDTIPMVPDRLSYKEMALDVFKYPSEWTESFDDYLEHADQVVALLREYMDNYDAYSYSLKAQREHLMHQYFNGDKIYDSIK